MEGTPSVHGPNDGKSAGVMICVRKGIGIAPVASFSSIVGNQRNPYEIVPGHCAIMRVNCWVRGGFLVGSVYLDVHDKLGVKNRVGCL